MPKKTPMRMCVACRQMRPKKELVRVVRTPEGQVLMDTTGRANGRGAYLCHDVECLKKARKSKALERALETNIGSEAFEKLEEVFADGTESKTV